MEEIERQMLIKLQQIRSLLEVTPSHRRPIREFRKWILKKESTSEAQWRSGHDVVIFYSEVMDTEWLQAALNSHQFKKIKCSRFQDTMEIKQEAYKYNFCIYLCHEHNWRNILSPLWSEAMKKIWEVMPLIVVMADMEDSGETQKTQILQSLQCIGIDSRHLFLFSKLETSTYMKHLSTKSQQNVMLGELKANDLQGVRNNSAEDKTHKRHIVGIFSRSSSDDYSWLMRLLTSDDFKDQIQEVRPCYIANNGFPQFIDDLSQCTIGILYHSKNKGRVNITNVTSSLYDEELEYLEKMLGRDNVIVMIDDLEDNSDMEKTRILKTQPSIGMKARNLLLISQREKADEMIIVTKLKSIEQFCHPSEQNSNRRDSHQRPKPSNDNPVPPSHDIVIFSILEDFKVDWLWKLLSELFSHRQVTCQQLSLHDGLNETALRCKFGIIYHSMRSTRPNTSEGGFLYHRVLHQMSGKLDRNNVMLIIDDLRDHRDQEEMRNFCNQLHIEKLASEVLLISHTEKADEMQILKKLKNITQLCYNSEHSRQENSMLPKLETMNICSPETSAPTKPIIAIFSISEERHVQWLMSLLSSDIFGHQHVTFHSISPDNRGLGAAEFRCKVAVLYHTMQIGGFPLTPHRESFYNNVLQLLSGKLGKDNVVLIIDDLQHRNHNQRKWVMKIRPDIERFAGDLYTILAEDKEDEMKLVQKLKKVKQFHPVSEHLHKPDPTHQTSKTLNTYSQMNPTPPRSVIGIFSVSEEGHSSWLRRLLSSNNFGQTEVTYHKMPSYDNVGLEEGKLQCRVAILYHTMKIGAPVTRQGEFIYYKVTDQLRQKLGKANVVVLIDDLPNNIDRNWVMWSQSKIEKLAGDLLYIRQDEKYDEKLLVQKLKSLKPFPPPSEYRPKADRDQPTSGALNTRSAPARPVIGVFSRSEKSKFNWFYKLLSSEEFGNHQVTFHQISPNDIKGFKSMVSHCKFGILYHCIKTGYPILTDHEDSLYDEELQYLSSTIGKRRTMVVIDETSNSDEEAKSWLLENQPSLGIWARDVLLFTTSEKALQEKPNSSLHTDRTQRSVYEKLSTLKKILKEEMTSASFSSSEGFYL